MMREKQKGGHSDLVDVWVGSAEIRIHTLRGQRVILDADLAHVYGVSTKRLNEQVRRNRRRFPSDFVFRLTSKEADSAKASRSQFATLKRGQNIKYLPHAFTEHGAIMAAAVLNSPKAIEMSVFVVRAFVKMREQLSATRELALRLAEIEKTLIAHDAGIVDLYERIKPLLLPPEGPVKKKEPIGFQVRERRPRYSLSPQA